MGPNTNGNGPREYKQKFFAGERVFVYLAIAFGIALGLQLLFGELNWVDACLFVLYLAAMLGLAAYSAYYPDVIISADGFSYRVFIRYKTVPWEAVREVAAYPEDIPAGVSLSVGEKRLTKLLFRRRAVVGFDEMMADLVKYVPAERWRGFDLGDEEDDG